MVCLPNTKPVIDDMSVVEFVARRARLLGLAKVYPYAAVTKGLEGRELAEMGMLAEAGAVAFTDGVRAVADARVMRQALQYAGTFDLMIVQHPEEPSLARGGDMNAGEMATRLGLSGIPREAEIIMVERDLRLAELTGGRLHFAHLSTATAIDAVRRAKARGLAVTCDTAPPYFALNENAIGDYRTFAKLSPPLRAEEDRLAVIEGLLDGTIDAIASDHAPEDEDAKRLPFAQASFGGIGLETLLAVSLELHHNRRMALLDILRLLTSGPADLLDLPAGRLAPGARADLDPVRPGAGLGGARERAAQQVEEHPLRLQAAAGPRAADRGRRSAGLRPRRLMLTTYAIIAAVAGYLFGSVPFGLLLTRAAGLGDVRAIGSGNIGTTNVLRTGRKGLAAATLLLDAGKGAAAALIFDRWGIEYAVVAGHRRRPRPLLPRLARLSRRQGGGDRARRAVRPGLAGRPRRLRRLAGDGLRPSLLLARRAVAFALSPVAALILAGHDRLPIALAAGLIAALVFLRHRDNIRRLRRGEETKIGAKASQSPPANG